MKRHLIVITIVYSFIFSVLPMRTAEVTAAVPEDPAHRELRAIKDAFVTSFNRRDYDGFLGFLHPNVVATWQNAEVVRHPDGVKAFMKKMSEGDTKKVESAEAEVTADEPASLYHDNLTGVAFGSLVQNFKFADGSVVKLNSRWTVTFIKENGRWWLAAIHVSADIFDNPVLKIATHKTAQWTGIVAGILGLAVGFVIARLRKAKAVAV